jgi:SDR family mycofactocin-dependent oxidoreductase
VERLMTGAEQRTGRVAGKVALITGAARGIGRAHAVRLAEEGADLVLLDLCADLPESSYGMAVGEDLAETARLAEAEGARVVARRGDVRVQADLDAAVAAAVDGLGGLDIVVPNAGLSTFGKAWELSEDEWDTVLGVVLTGAWHTMKAAVPAMIAGGSGGSIVVIGSAVGTRAATEHAHYVAAKHGVVGLARAFALEVAPHSIRVNVVAPGSVDTVMSQNPEILKLRRPDLEAPTVADAEEQMIANHALPIRWTEPRDIANAVLWLASEESRHITGAVVPVDAGWAIA